MDYAQRILDEFHAHFNGRPLLIRSPGRVNLLGEHTDYNQGFVLPGAIDRAVWFAVEPRIDRQCRVFAVNLDKEYRFSLDRLEPSGLGWPDYLIGAVDQLLRQGYGISGFDCAFGGDIPLGAGLSSSAALEAGLIFALDQLFMLELDRLALVKMAQKAENEFVGVNCGIMDQYVNIFGQSEHLLQIDCRSLTHTPRPFHFPELALLLFNSNVSHSLAASEYNQRRQECAQGVDVIRKGYPELSSLRDVTAEMLAASRKELDDRVYRRCRYVIGENERMIRAVEALDRQDAAAFGVLMSETHRGLRDDYEVSCPELDFLAERGLDCAGVHGSRMMGGGFGGCTVNLVEKQAVGEISRQVLSAYRDRFGKEAEAIVTAIGPGTAVVGKKQWN